MRNDEDHGIQAFLNRFPLFRIVLVLFLVLLLQIPITMISGAVKDRENRRRHVVEDVTAKWGKQQTVVGPSISVPYLVEVQETDGDGRIRTRKATRHAVFLPDELHIAAKTDCDVRYRGIYQVPVYRMALTLSGQFSHPEFVEWEVAPEDILWDRAHLTFGISDVHAVTHADSLAWNDEELEFLPGIGEFGAGETGIHVDLKSRLSGGVYAFTCDLSLNGSEGVFFAPFGRQTIVTMDSNWAAPSFQGHWLPTERTLNSDGFSATWDIPYIARNYPQRWRSETGTQNAVHSSFFGVTYVTPVDQYRMAQRSLKYEILFLVLTFGTLWLFEILVHARVHSVQYLFVGAGMCLFYLLELSLSEHIGFLAAYAIAAAAIVILVSSYCIAVLKGVGRAATVGTAITVLYGYLYVLLTNQDYSLLIGSIGLFVILATVMCLTSGTDWFSLHTQRRRKESSVPE